MIAYLCKITHKTTEKEWMCVYINTSIPVCDIRSTYYTSLVTVARTKQELIDAWALAMKFNNQKDPNIGSLSFDELKNFIKDEVEAIYKSIE